MADMRFVRENRLIEEGRARWKPMRLLCSVLCLGGGWAAWNLGLPEAGLLAFVAAAVLFLAFLASTGSRDDVKLSGAEGELAVEEVLRRLPGDYTVFNQVELPDLRSSVGRREIDFVVCGPNGVFVIEVKNWRGTIEGAAKDRFWTLHKTGRRGGYYSKEHHNPLPQVRMHMAVLRKYLKARGLTPPLHGLLVFASGHLEQEVQADGVWVGRIEGLCDHILSVGGNLPPRWREKAVAALARVTAEVPAAATG